MPGPIRKCLLAWVFALAAFVAGCGSGGDGSIPPRDADSLLSLVAAVRNDVSEGNCEFARNHAAELVNQIDALPADVAPEVADELNQAAKNLDRLASDPSQCTETGASGLSGSTSTTTTTSVAPTTTVPETTTTETTTSNPETTNNGQSGQQPAGQGNQGGAQGGSQGTGGGGGGPASGGVTGGGSAG